MGWVGPALMFGGNVLQGVAAIQGGNAAAAEGKARQNEMNARAETIKIEADQQHASMVEDLQRTTGTINALIASRGLDLSSPSALALTEGAQAYSYRDINRMRFNAVQNESGARVAGARARLSGRMAQQAGYVSAASSLFKGASEGWSYFHKPSPRTGGVGGGAEYG